MALIQEEYGQQQQQQQQGAVVGLLEDLRNEVLEMNSYGMHLCQEKHFDEAHECLSTALLRVQSGGDAGAGSDAATALDQLKATTLNNIGVVECHRGDYANSLDHLEAAQSLEYRLGTHSPSTALNLCAVYNATGDYERASASALEAINLLHAAEDGGLSDETKSLWGAAWHNLGIAELNSDRPNKNVDVLCTFRNAMRATKDLLGPRHPMTIAVHETYRNLRDRLKEEGAFKERTPSTSALPRIARSQKLHPVPPQTDHPTQHALMGATNTHGNGKYVAPPTASRFATMPAYAKATDKPMTARGGRRPVQDLFHPTASMRTARRQYLAPHPIFQQHQHHHHAPTSRMGTAATAAYSQQQQQQGQLPPVNRQSNTRGGTAIATTEFIPAPPPPPPAVSQRAAAPSSSVRGNNNSNNAATAAPPRRRLSELLLGDMWVEVQVPRHTSSPHHQQTSYLGGGGSPTSQQRSPIRPGYGEALYVIDPSDAALEPIVEPGTYARLDYSAGAPPAAPKPTKTAESAVPPKPQRAAAATASPAAPSMAAMPENQEELPMAAEDDAMDAAFDGRAMAPPAPAAAAAPNEAPAAITAARPERPPSTPHRSAMRELEVALGGDMQSYPSLAALVEARKHAS